MSEAVDELFGEAGDAARPRTTWILALLIGGVLLALAGMACTAVPGGLLVLGAWAMVEKDLDRVDAGYLALDHRPTLSTLRSAVWGGLALVVILFVAQSVLLCTGFYFQFWATLIESMRPLALDAGSPPVP